MPITTFSDISNAYYINLDHRKDRDDHINVELLALGLKASRFKAIGLKNGAIGCTMSHLKLLETALEQHMDHILIMEDDITFLDPELFKKQFNTFIQNCDNNWDVILFGGNNVPPFKAVDSTCIQVSRCQTTTGYLVNRHYIPHMCKNIKEGLQLLISNPQQHYFYAIDKYWFALQQSGRWFLIIPATIIQYEGYSDIEKRTTNYANMMIDPYKLPRRLTT